MRLASAVQALPLALSLCAMPARATTLADGKLELAGFGQSGYGRTSGNAYSVGTREGEYSNVNFGLVVTAHPVERTTFAAQAFFDIRGRADADWAFVEWRFDDWLRLRLGKVNQPVGLFGEIPDVGTARPFFALPASIYGSANLGGEAYYGAGVTGEATIGDGWDLAYDLYAGEVPLTMYQPFEIAASGPPYDFGQLETAHAAARILGTRLSLALPIEGLSVGVSAFTGKHVAPSERPGSVRMIVVGLSAEYDRDGLSCRAEVFRGAEGTDETNLAGYLEAAAFVTRRVQVAARVEGYETSVDAYSGPSSLLRHREGAIGVNYWPAPQLAFKLSYHEIRGNRFAVPPDAVASTSLPERTHLAVAGAQFSF